MNDELRQERKHRLIDSLPDSARIDAANSHAQSVRDCMADSFPVSQVRQRLRTMPNDRRAYMSFIEGWDKAMALRLPNLSAENDRLHRIVFDLTSKLQVKVCDACDGNAISCDVCKETGFVDA